MSIRVDGNDLPEYEEPETEEQHSNEETETEEQHSDDHETSVRYVEAISGANFSIELRTNPAFEYVDYDLRMQVFLDGVSACSIIKDAQPETGRIKESCTGVKRCIDGTWHLEKFVFAELQTSKHALFVNFVRRLEL